LKQIKQLRQSEMKRKQTKNDVRMESVHDYEDQDPTTESMVIPQPVFKQNMPI
jgi:hypothetical protein